MGIHTRVGLVAGTIGFALLYLAQPLSGAAAAALVLLVGLLAGLGTAKWLPRDWYGRQLEAGARAGVLACAVALAGFVISLLVAGPYSVAALAARSHLVGIDLGAAVRALSVVGWLGAGVALALAGLAAGTGVAALASQFGAWDKNRHAIEVVKRARAAAQRGGRLATTAPRTRPSLPDLPGLSPEFGGQPDAARATPIPSPLAPSSPPSLPSWPSLSDTPPPDRDLSGSDLSGLNESWHSLRSPLSVFPAPEASATPWTRHDERLPPGALLPDELALDGAADEDAFAPASDPIDPNDPNDPNDPHDPNDPNATNATNATNGAAPATWDGTAWREDAGWMDYEDGASAPAEPVAPAPAGAPPLDGGAADGTDGAEEDGQEPDSWLN